MVQVKLVVQGYSLRMSFMKQFKGVFLRTVLFVLQFCVLGFPVWPLPLIPIFHSPLPLSFLSFPYLTSPSPFSLFPSPFFLPSPVSPCFPFMFSFPVFLSPFGLVQFCFSVVSTGVPTFLLVLRYFAQSNVLQNSRIAGVVMMICFFFLTFMCSGTAEHSQL